MISTAISLILGLVSFVGWIPAIAFLLLVKWYRKPSSNFPPGPRGIPVLGVLPFAGKYPERAIRSWVLGGSYGPVMSVRIGSEDIVFLNSYYSIYQAFVKNAAAFSGRPRISILQEISKNQGLIMVDYNNYHKAMRQFANQALRRFGYGKVEMEEVCNDEIDKLIERLQQKADIPIDITTELSIMTANMVFNMTCGRRCAADDPTFRRCIWLVHKSFANTEDSLYLSMMIMFYSLRHIPPFRGARERWLLYQSELLGHFKKEIEEHRKNLDPDNVKDFIDAYLVEQQNEMNTQGKVTKFTDSELELLVRDIFGGGVETSVTMVRWCITCLLHHPQFEKLIVEEIDDAMGTSGKASLSLKDKMPITFAFIQEVFRYRPVSPLNIPHITTENTKLYGFSIPKGTTVVANFWAAHLDPAIWEKPMNFDPYRHINCDGEFVYSEKVISFSMGPRVCFGEKLGRMEVFAIFVRLLQNFEIRNGGKELPSLHEGTNMIAFAPLPFDVILRERE